MIPVIKPNLLSLPFAKKEEPEAYMANVAIPAVVIN
jgi:hypothetical protein